MFDPEIIRRATNDDLEQIYSIEKNCFSINKAYTKKQLKYLITYANSSCLVETFNELIRGFIIVLYRKGTNTAAIETINVDPDYHKMGIGKKLLFAAESDIINTGINRIRLEVSLGNTVAIQLYEKSGYRIISFLKNYYQYEHFGTKDAYRMVKSLIT